MLPIIHHPNDILRQKARVVTAFDNSLKELVGEMYSTMYKLGGIGLAANQVGDDRAVFVLDLGTKSKPKQFVAVNPEIGVMRGVALYPEGCLSLPRSSVKVARPTEISLISQDADGKQQEWACIGKFARAVQHEVDHLNGVLIVDHGLEILR